MPFERIAVKQYLPESLKVPLRRVVSFFSTRHFKPYIKKKNVEGIVFDFWIGDLDSRNWYDLHCQDPQWLEMRFIRDKMIQPGDIVLESGAHHGCTTIVLSRWVGENGKVIAFEPVPANASIIRKNIELNQIKNVWLESKAVGATSGHKVKISGNSNSSVRALGQGREVDLTCLDQYEYLNPTFLKVDVEGFEVEVLKGAQRILRKRPKLAIEVHPEALPGYGTSVQELLSLINLASYEWWVQWDDDQYPQPYNLTTLTTKRAHLFGIPKSN